MEKDLVARVEQRIVEEKLADPGDVIVVAVSGGPDSVALLHVLFCLADTYQWTTRCCPCESSIPG